MKEEQNILFLYNHMELYVRINLHNNRVHFVCDNNIIYLPDNNIIYLAFVCLYDLFENV